MAEPWLDDLWRKHRGKLTGAAVGFLVGLLWRSIGLFWTIVIGVLTAVGYWIGRQVDDEDETLLQWLERFMSRSRGG